MNEESIFAAALEKKTAGERQAYLDEACAGNSELRAAVEELLRADDDAGSFLRHAPAGLGVTAEATVDGPEASNSVSLPLLEPCDKPDRIGKLVGKVGEYEIIEVVGSGGMGTVLRAFDTKLSRVVAVKVIAPELAANAEAVKRFLREAQAAAAVVHDHVVTIHAVDESHQPPFLVMQFIDGQTLQQKIEREGALELKHVLRIGSQAAAGLAAAHKTGLIHRDVKPSNILLENGVERVKITDFGLARAADDLEMTKTGQIAGTPQYMSPEQAKGEPIDARSDLFSLGSVLYTMCTGRPAFRAETTMGVLRRVCDDTPRPIHEVNAEIPPWLEAIVGKLLAKNPADRFQSAGEVAELLSQHLAHVQQPALHPQPVAWDKLAQRAPAHQRGAGVSPAKISRRWSLATAILLLLTTTLALAETTGVTHVAATVIRIVRGDGTLVVEVDDPNIQVLLDGEELVITGAGPKELRLRPGQHELQTVKGGKPTDSKVITITRDGRQVVKVARDAPRAAAPAGPSSRLVWANAAAEASSSSLSPDGRFLAFVDWDTGDLKVRDLATGKDRSLTNKTSWFPSGEFADRPRFSGDGAQVAFTWYDKDGKADLRIVNVEGGEPRVVYASKNDGVYPTPCDWTYDAKTILATLQFSVESPGSAEAVPPKQRRLQLALIVVADGSVRSIDSYEYRPRIGDLRRRYALAPDGRTIAYNRAASPDSAVRDIFLIDVETGQEAQLTTHSADKTVLGWTPDGQRLLFDMDQQGTRDAWLIRIVGGKPQGEATLVKKDLGVVDPIGITRDGGLYYGSSYREPNIFTATLDWEKGIATATPLAAEKFDTLNNFALGDWSPDGEHLAYWASLQKQRTKELRILSMKTGKTRVLKPNLQAPNVYLRWSPDGKSFIVADRRQGNASAIYQIDTESGRATVVVEPSGRDQPGTSRPAWSRDGRGIFYFQRPKAPDETMGIVYRDLQTRMVRDVVPPGNLVFDGRRVFSFEPSPDGRQLALFGRPNDESLVLWLIPVEGGTPSELLRLNGRETYAGGVAWTPDGRFILFVCRGDDETQRGLWYISASGGQPRKFTLPGVRAIYDTQIRMHPDGKQLAIGEEGSKRTDIWALENFLPQFAESTAPIAPAAAASAPNVAAVQPLRNLVAAKERSLKIAQGRFEAKVGTRMEVLAAEVEHTEARIRLAEAEQQKSAGRALLKELVAQRQEERDLISRMVERGVATQDELNQADARLADASARLAQANSNNPVASEAPQH